MDILISNNSGKPIYDQIATQIKNKILNGELSPGDPLPSIRFLARELRISVITTKRAYSDLEQDGFIETIPGKGSFVSQKNNDFLIEENLRRMEKYLEEACDLAHACGLSLEEITDTLTFIYKGDS